MCRYDAQNKVSFAKSTCLMCGMTVWETVWTRTHPRVLESAERFTLQNMRIAMGNYHLDEHI